MDSAPATPSGWARAGRTAMREFRGSFKITLFLGFLACSAGTPSQGWAGAGDPSASERAPEAVAAIAPAAAPRGATLDLARAALEEPDPLLRAIRLGSHDAPSTAPLRLDDRLFPADDLKAAFSSFLRSVRPDSGVSTETLALFRADFALRRLVAERARREGFDRQEETRRLIEQRVDEILADQYLRRSILGDISVSATEIEQYYETHPEEFAKPRLATLRIIVAGSESEAAEATRLLNEGVEFEKVAESHSIHASRQKGGLLKPMPRGSLDTRVEEAAWKLKPGEFTRPIPVGGLFYVAQLVEISPPRVEPLEDARPRLLEMLYENKRRERLRGFSRNLLEGRRIILFEPTPEAAAAQLPPSASGAAPASGEGPNLAPAPAENASGSASSGSVSGESPLTAPPTPAPALGAASSPAERGS
jgi:peptidyl-prolyl cis-trans isomerase C